MGIRDSGSLSARERADLANLEARAVADDPRLASHLRGHGDGLRLRRPRLPDWSRWARWGPVALVVGLALAVLALPVGVALSLGGLAVAVLGAFLTARLAEDHWARRQGGAERSE